MIPPVGHRCLRPLRTAKLLTQSYLAKVVVVQRLGSQKEGKVLFPSVGGFAVNWIDQIQHDALKCSGSWSDMPIRLTVWGAELERCWHSNKTRCQPRSLCFTICFHVWLSVRFSLTRPSLASTPWPVTVSREKAAEILWMTPCLFTLSVKESVRQAIDGNQANKTWDFFAFSC